MQPKCLVAHRISGKVFRMQPIPPNAAKWSSDSLRLATDCSSVSGEHVLGAIVTVPWMRTYLLSKFWA